MYFIVFFTIIVGLSFILYNTFMLYKRTAAKEIYAEIIGSNKNVRNNGYIRYTYKFFWDNGYKIIDGPSQISLNPFSVFFNNTQIGNKVYIKYDDTKQRVLPNVTNIIIYLLIGIFICAIGIGMLISTIVFY